MRYLSSIIVVIFSVLIIACNSSDESQKTITTDFSSLESAVESIHALFNQQQFEVLYSHATTEAQNKFPKKQFMSFIGYLRETLGEVEKAEITNKLEMDNRQTAVVLDVEYENDSGTERWVLRHVEEEWRWTEFNYNAPSLTNKNN